MVVPGRHCMTSLPGPMGSPGNRSDAPPTMNGCPVGTRCPSARRWVWRTRLSIVATHICSNGFANSSATAANASCRPAFNAPIVSVRATTVARFGQRSVRVVDNTPSTRSAISAALSPRFAPIDTCRATRSNVESTVRTIRLDTVARCSTTAGRESNRNPGPSSVW